MYDIKECYLGQLEKNEYIAISNTKEKSKYFYSYAKARSNTRSNMKLMKDVASNLLSDPTNIAETLLIHFFSVYSDPNANGVRSPKFASPNITKTATGIELVIAEREIENVISEIKCRASQIDGIPAKLIENCAKVI